MIFAELHYEQHYGDAHSSLVELLGTKFSNIEHGLQGDSWIWVFDGDKKVAVDTFSSMKHQVKSDVLNRELVDRVIHILSTRFQVHILPEPEKEPHDEW